MKMKRFGLLLVCFAMIAALSACASNAAVTPTPTPISPIMTPLPGVTGMGTTGPTPTDNVPTAAMTVAESTALSKKANDAAVKISEIDSCVTAIIGDTCVAGVTFTEQYQGQMTDRIRDMVTARIQSVAPVVERVAVTTDPEIAAQISSVAEKIAKASTLGDLTGELDGVISRIQ